MPNEPNTQKLIEEDHYEQEEIVKRRQILFAKVFISEKRD